MMKLKVQASSLEKQLILLDTLALISNPATLEASISGPCGPQHLFPWTGRQVFSRHGKATCLRNYRPPQSCLFQICTPKDSVAAGDVSPRSRTCVCPLYSKNHSKARNNFMCLIKEEKERHYAKKKKKEDIKDEMQNSEGKKEHKQINRYWTKRNI